MRIEIWYSPTGAKKQRPWLARIDGRDPLPIRHFEGHGVDIRGNYNVDTNRHELVVEADSIEFEGTTLIIRGE